MWYTIKVNALSGVQLCTVLSHTEPQCRGTSVLTVLIILIWHAGFQGGRNINCAIFFIYIQLT